MASLRKRHRETTDELPPERDLVPTPREAAAAPYAKPGAVADIPPPAADAAPVRPVEDEEKTAMRKRLQEMDAAQERVKQLETQIAQQAQIARQLQEGQPQQQNPQPPQDVDVSVIIEDAPIPERAKVWLRQHTEYITDPALNARMQGQHHVAKYLSGQEFTDQYFQRLEELLGLQQPTTNGDDEVQHS